jgi:cytidylate kinase
MSAAIRVVTVAREYGSGGALVAARVAEALGFRLLDRAIVEEAARGASCDPGVAEKLDEHVAAWRERLARSLAHGGFEGVASVSDADILDAERMAVLTRHVIEEAAEGGGCVIVGRGAQCVLAGRADAFHVFVYAPREARARRLRGRLGPEADVEAAMDKTDRERAAYLKRYFGRDWAELSLYHMMISSALGIETAAAAILGAIAAAGGASRA